MATYNTAGMVVTTSRVQPLPANDEIEAVRRLAAELLALLEHAAIDRRRPRWRYGRPWVSPGRCCDG